MNKHNDRHTRLDLDHRTLDAAVCAANGWPTDMPDDQILEKLLSLNAERRTTTERDLSERPQ